MEKGESAAKPCEDERYDSMSSLSAKTTSTSSLLTGGEGNAVGYPEAFEPFSTEGAGTESKAMSTTQRTSGGRSSICCCRNLRLGHVRFCLRVSKPAMPSRDRETRLPMALERSV